MDPWFGIHTDKAYLTMKHFSENELITYLNKIMMKLCMLIMYIKLKD